MCVLGLRPRPAPFSLLGRSGGTRPTTRSRPPRFAAPTNSSDVRLTPEIIEGMQQLALEQRRLLGPRAPWHVGDVAWGLRQHEGREPEWTFRL